MKLQMFLTKNKNTEIGAIHCNKGIKFVKLERRLYGDYFLTSIGIFKFRFDGWYRSMKMYHCKVILPLHMNQIEDEKK